MKGPIDWSRDQALVSRIRLIPAISITSGLAAIGTTLIAPLILEGAWRVAAACVAAAVFVMAVAFATRGLSSLSGRLLTTQLNDDDELAFDDRLLALDEANEYFSTSLNAADMFRLVSNRVNEIFPFGGSALLVPLDEGNGLKLIHFDGANPDHFVGLELKGFDSIAGKAFQKKEVVIENDISAERKAIGEERLNGWSASAAIPLVHSDAAFAVLVLYRTDPIPVNADTIKVLEAVGEHVTPIFRNSLEFERSLSNALTDAITGLPNERAFFMVLENQLAECIRNRDERPLSILTIDIRDFGAVNAMLGHSIGDRMLEFAGSRISEHLRRMDFLARTVNDEFGVILPTACEKTAVEVIERIREGFSRIEFDVADGDAVYLELNVGWATFWKDGETAAQLVRAAQQRKRQAKSEVPAGVLWFRKEYVH